MFRSEQHFLFKKLLKIIVLILVVVDVPFGGYGIVPQKETVYVLILVVVDVPFGASKMGQKRRSA